MKFLQTTEPKRFLEGGKKCGHLTSYLRVKIQKERGIQPEEKRN